jgi:hypothetical protein
MQKEKSVSMTARTALALTCGPTRIGKSATVLMIPFVVLCN